MSQLKIYTRRKIASKKQNLDHNGVLHECCKSVRHLQRSILLVRGDHCIGDWECLPPLTFHPVSSFLMGTRIQPSQNNSDFIDINIFEYILSIIHISRAPYFSTL